MSDQAAVRPMSFGDIFTTALRNYGRSFLPLFIVAFVFQVLATLVMIPMTQEQERIQAELIKNPLVMPQVDPLLFFARVLVTFVIILMLTVLVQGGITVFYVSRLLGENSSLAKVFGRIMPIAGRLFGLSALVSILVAAGPLGGLILALILGSNPAILILLAVAGVVVSIMFALQLSLSGIALVVESISIREALVRSRDLSLGSRGKIFLIGLIYFAAVFVLSIPIGFIGVSFPNSFVVGLLSALVAAAVYPFLLCGLIQIYLSARAAQEHLDDERLKSEFLDSPN